MIEMKKAKYHAWGVFDKRNGCFRQIYKTKKDAEYYQKHATYIHSAEVRKVILKEAKGE